MNDDDVIRALLCEKAELIKREVRAKPGVLRDVIRMSIDGIDSEIGAARARLAEKERKASAVVVRWTRKVA